MKQVRYVFFFAFLAFCLVFPPLAAQTQKYKVAIVVKSLGNGFFDAVRDGALEASKELKNVEIIYQGPTTPTAAGQIEIIEGLINLKVNAIVVSSNDATGLVDVCKKATAAGIKVISFDSEVAEAGRILHLAPSDSALIGKSQVKLIGSLIGNKGEVAILSAAADSANQNAWIEYMKTELLTTEFKGMKLVEVVYGDDKADKSYKEAVALIKKYPNLRGIIAPTTVGVAAAAKAIKDNGKKDIIELVGLGLPSEMRSYIEQGICKKVALWNPIDLGYSATYIAVNLITSKEKVSPGTKFSAGRMGTISVGAGNVAIMGEPFTFTKENIAKFSILF